MIADFNKAFFPTEDEKAASKAALIKITEQEKQFWISSGLNEKEYRALEELESDELSRLQPYQAYSYRRSLVSCNIISMEQVHLDIEKWIHRRD